MRLQTLIARSTCKERILGSCSQGAEGRVTFVLFSGACLSRHCNERIESRDLVIRVVESIHDFKWQKSKVVNKSRFKKSFFVPD